MEKFTGIVVGHDSLWYIGRLVRGNRTLDRDKLYVDLIFYQNLMVCNLMTLGKL